MFCVAAAAAAGGLTIIYSDITTIFLENWEKNQKRLLSVTKEQRSRTTAWKVQIGTK